MSQDESTKTTNSDQKQNNSNQAQELTDQELAKVSGGALRRTGDEDLEDLEVER